MKKTATKTLVPKAFKTLQEGMNYHHQGNLTQAKSSYLRVLQLYPDQPDALHLLGVLALSNGRADKALELIDKAISTNPGVAEYHLNKGIALKAQNRLDAAIISIKKAIQLKPDFAAAHFNLGKIRLSQRKLEGAEASFRKVLSIDPAHAESYNNLATTLKIRGHFKEAEQFLVQAIAIKKDYFEAFNNLGNICHLDGRLQKALECYEKALKLRPDQIAIRNNLANVLLDLGNEKQAIENYQQVVAQHPQSFEAHYNLGNAHTRQHHLLAAEAHYRKAISINSDYPEIYNNLGGTLLLQGKQIEAAICFRQALKLKPDYSDALDNLIDAQLRLCDWSELENIRQRLLDPALNSWDTTQTPPRPFLVTRLPIPVADGERQKIARAMVRKKTSPFLSLQQKVNFTHRSHNDSKRLKLAYISTDFNNHATSHLVHELFHLHNRSLFEVFCYSIGQEDASIYRQKIIQNCDIFRDFNDQPIMGIAEQIHRDEIDILIDLNGHTAANRIEIFALRPAPIQITYLGFPSTTGADFFDYVITDQIVTPSEKQAFFDEAFIYMPHSYQINSSREVDPNTPSRQDCGLPEQSFVFCCFNNHYKIEPMIFDVWARILKRVPDSVLWLLGGSDTIINNLRREIGKRDVAPERLIFGEKMPVAQHLARHRQADLFLDTHFYNAHTTASDALYMGLPVITCPGESFASRVGQSLVTAAGLPELAVPDFDIYEDTAVRLANNPEELQMIKRYLIAQRTICPLFDISLFTKNLEQAYHKIWQIYQSGETARKIIVECVGITA